MRVRMERRSAEEGGGRAVKVGMARVDREGGLRMARLLDLGPFVGRPPGRAPRRMPPPLEKASALIVVSWFTAASKSGDNLCESMGSGTR